MNYYDEIYEYGYSSLEDDEPNPPFDDIELTEEELEALLATEPPF